jgi:hypothetical protein
MKSTKFSKGFYKDKIANRSKGNYDKIVISGCTMSIYHAVKKHPLEVFNMMLNKKVKLGILVYMQLLEKVKEIDPNLVYEHRKPYKAPFVSNVSKKYNFEVDFVIRHILQGVEFDRLYLKTAGKPKVYTSMNSLDSNEQDIKSLQIKRKSNIYRVLEEE